MPAETTFTVEPIVLPVLGAEPIDDRTRIRIASLIHDGMTIVPVFSSEDHFNSRGPAGSAGLLLHIEQLVQLLRPDDEVVLDPGTPRAMRCRTTDLVALTMWLHREG